MSVAVDADVETGSPDIAGSGRPVDHADLEPLEAAAHLHGKSGIVGRIAIDHCQRLPELAEAAQDRLLLPVPCVP